jgi:ABC-type branched-subunit amino acid transport system ATPase component
MTATAAGALLTLDGVSKSFGGLVAVEGLSFGVAPQSITALIGPNGAGKTTVFNLISGLLRCDRGRIVFRGQDISRLRPQAITRAGLVRTFQIPRVYARMTVIENLLVVGSRTRRSAALDLLARSGLADVAEEYAGDLSYGQQKILDVARALILEPQLILLDEPTAGASRLEQTRLFELLHTLRDAGTAFLVIEHQMEVVREHSDNVVVVNFGKKIAEGPYGVIRRDELVLDAYFGR